MVTLLTYPLFTSQAVQFASIQLNLPPFSTLVHCTSQNLCCRTDSYAQNWFLLPRLGGFSTIWHFIIILGWAHDKITQPTWFLSQKWVPQCNLEQISSLGLKRSLPLGCFKGKNIVIALNIPYLWKFFQNGKISR